MNKCLDEIFPDNSRFIVDFEVFNFISIINKANKI